MSIAVTGANFTLEVEQSSIPVLIDFHAQWCGPCKMIAPILEEIAKERTDIKIVKVDVDAAQDLAQKFGVMSIPTLVLYKSGRTLTSWVGLRPKPVLLKDIDEALAK